MTETASRRPRLNQDVECLRCGALNLPENHICGRCGANLPMAYDEEGNVLDREARERERLRGARRGQFGGPSLQTAWLVRLTVIILLILIVLWISKHR